MNAIKVEDQEQKGPGLSKGFAIGERLPWKGMVFEVEAVEYDRLTLKVLGITKRKAAEVVGRMRA